MPSVESDEAITRNVENDEAIMRNGCEKEDLII